MADIRCAVCGRVNYFDDEDRRSRYECRDCGEDLDPPPGLRLNTGAATTSDVPAELAARGAAVGLFGMFVGGLLAYVAIFTLFAQPVVAVASIAASVTLFAAGQMARGGPRQVRTREAITRGLWMIGMTLLVVVIAASVIVVAMIN